MSSTHVLKAVQCGATARSTGARCRRWTIRGATVCQVHGGAAGQVRRKAAERVALADALAASPVRHPATILLDGLHLADHVAQEALASGDTEAALSASATAGLVARAVIAANAEARAAHVSKVDPEHLAALVDLALRWLGQDTTKAHVRLAVADAVDAALEHAKDADAAEVPLPTWVLEAGRDVRTRRWSTSGEYVGREDVARSWRFAHGLEREHPAAAVILGVLHEVCLQADLTEDQTRAVATNAFRVTSQAVRDLERRAGAPKPLTGRVVTAAERRALPPGGP